MLLFQSHRMEMNPGHQCQLAQKVLGDGDNKQKYEGGERRSRSSGMGLSENFPPSSSVAGFFMSKDLLEVQSFLRAVGKRLAWRMRVRRSAACSGGFEERVLERETSLGGCVCMNRTYVCNERTKPPEFLEGALLLTVGTRINAETTPSTSYILPHGAFPQEIFKLEDAATVKVGPSEGDL
ncbi:hypothetical protein KQX54_019005 [Cotesia glomerata]|uniref:Uncharacterized protein n=1 Tax=Cotesia glomerata TaxID=32391 RepID=A0AAV7IAW9_COTGL|nr:hypothetical protein KQX54_019005 [Cotesia glomerata]